MPLPTSSLAKICDQVRMHVETLGTNSNPVPTLIPEGWSDVSVSIGAPGINLKSDDSSNKINLFFYRFEPFGFAADASPSDVQWMKVICLITALGKDEPSSDDDDYSAGINELRMLSQVMRLFQEQPIMNLAGDSEGESWHTQFIPRPLADEQINQIWSSQGSVVYRPSVVYEIALAPIEPELQVPQAAKVGSFGTYSSGNMENKHLPWPSEREILFPVVSSTVVDATNPQWAPVIAMVTGPESDRQASISINFEVPNGAGGNANFSDFPEIDIVLAGGTSNNLYLVGQILQNPDKDKNSGKWIDIAAEEGLSTDGSVIDIHNLPGPGTTNFVLDKNNWTGIAEDNNSWQLQIFVERNIKFDAENNIWMNLDKNDAGIKIRSNPLLITITREGT